MGTRKAKITDVRRLKQLIDNHMQEGFMLPRPLNELYENVREFWVWDEDGEVRGCAGLHIYWADLAEIKSLAVDHAGRGRGWGRALIEACLEEARQLQIARVFALTQIPEFFRKIGFSYMDKAQFPHKVWAECMRCPKFQDCDEVAVGITVCEPLDSEPAFAQYGPRSLPIIHPPAKESS
ncbi:MAG: N-acetyltransferase [bacterium]|nr:N-acetyltransferase [bacterium]